MSTQDNSLLDRVMQSKQSKEITGLRPLEIIGELFKELSEKERDILMRRFGLAQQSKKESLESIGQTYKLTRERIRQIEADAIRKIRQSTKLLGFLQHIEAVLSQILEEHGGAMEEEHLFERLLEVAGDTASHRQSLLFLMDKLSDKYDSISRHEQWLPGWRLSVVQLDHLQEILAAVEKSVKSKNTPMTFEDIHDLLQKDPIYAKHGVNEKMLLSVLKLARSIDENPYGEFGLTEWPDISPRRMSDKIFIVLKKHGQPLHFVEIAEHINKAGFDHKKALPQTVHNELIVDKRFVLIGRGIYALTEWGYEPGIVSDVIAKVLRESGRPMSKDQIIDEVLKRRMVKKATIYISLINKNKFTKNEDGTYSLPQ